MSWVWSFVTLVGCDLWISDEDLCGPGVNRVRYYLDADEDGAGDPAAGGGCVPASRYVPNADDCDDADPTRHPETPQYRDADGDGVGEAAATAAGCEVLVGYSFVAGDCDDGDPARGAATPWYPDADGDGHGVGDALPASCTQPYGYAAFGDDCDDEDRTRSPDSFWYRDDDNDGYGLATDAKQSCETPEGYGAFEPGDCDDSDEHFTLQCPFESVSVGGFLFVEMAFGWPEPPSQAHSCGLRTDGSILCWGSDDEGQASPPDALYVPSHRFRPIRSHAVLPVEPLGSRRLACPTGWRTSA
ncbi:hypothetical protein LBMAG42_53850 [Deltaproteobacteria bacterium]|nr:hypothetical protein LBMAG42_53850 [Deltaproteobacteria bacterium]